MPDSLTDSLNAYRDECVLITGHTGFKGSWLSLWLSEVGADVHGIALDPVTQPSLFEAASVADCITDHRCDIRSSDDLMQLVRQVEPAVVFHLAAQPIVRTSYEQAKETFDTNLMGSVHVFEAVRDVASVRALVHVSSDKCYRESAETEAYNEDAPLGGHDPYSASKAASEIAFHSYKASYFDASRNLAAASGRAGNVIGGGDWAHDRLVPDAARAWSQSQKLAVRNPAYVRPWQHVLEALSGYLTLGSLLLTNHREARGSWNFGPADENVHTVQEVVDGMASSWGGAAWEAIVDEGAVHEAAYLNLSCQKAASTLAWQPRWGFDETIEKTILWYKAYYEGKSAKALCLEDIEAYLA